MNQRERDELLMRLDKRSALVDQHLINQKEINQDEEARIRSLEKKWWTTVGAFVITLLTTILTALLN